MKLNLGLTLVGLSASMVMGTIAFASHGGDMTSISMIRHDTEDTPTLKLVRIEGALSCDLGAENNGQACELRLREVKTGHLYHLVEARSAMQLYQGGSKNVVIEGRLADSDTLEVRGARTL